jgi:hypothetical protein
LVFIGIVTRANVSNGEIFVRVQNGFELQELHNVAIASPTNGQTLTYESATSLWKNTTPAGGSITIGTTPITSGTDGRILFQSGGVVEQSSLLFWDDANKRLGVGAPPATTVRLDVRAQGALSTDVAFRVRNSANTQNSFEVNGLGQGRIKSTGFTPRFAVSYDWFGAEIDAFIFTQNLQNFRGQQWTFDAGYNGAFEGLQISNDLTGNNKGQFTIQLNNYCFGTSMLNNDTGTAERRVLRIANGVAPTTSKADEIKFYSADIAAGNAAPHFRTENGSIVKLYQNAAVTTPQGLADALTNLGLLAASTIVNSIPTHDGPTYDTNAIQTLTAAEYAAIGTPNASTLYFIV